MSIHGNLRGKQWSVWTEELGPGSPPGDTGRGTENVMKLPKKDMDLFGQCPAWDNFVLVTCDKCLRNVKIEAFESHMTLRHGSKSEKQAYQRAKAAAADRTCQVKLTPVGDGKKEQQSKFIDMDTAEAMAASSSSSSTSPQPFFSRPPGGGGPSIQPADSASAPETRSPSPIEMDSPLAPHGTEDSRDAGEPMDIDQEADNDVEMSQPTSSSFTEKKKKKGNRPSVKYLGEEADSTTSINNVISIPDTDDIPNMEIGIISESGRVTDSINTKFNVASFKNDPPVDSTTVMTKGGGKIKVSLANAQKIAAAAAAAAPQQLSPAAFAAKQDGGPTAGHRTVQVARTPSTDHKAAEEPPTQYITVSPLSKASPKKVVVTKGGSQKVGGGREREYNPDKHCGVWDSDGRRHCTRSLTCKSHSVFLKRKVANRTAPFDELLAAHKAEKEAAMAKLAEPVAVAEQQEPQSILARRLQLAPGAKVSWEAAPQESGGKSAATVLKSVPTIVKKPTVVLQTQPVITKEIFCDENLHYTTDHPKPLAVCTFGGKRINGLFLADRSRLLTRKVMRVAIASTGISRLPTVSQKLTYTLTDQLAGRAKLADQLTAGAKIAATSISTVKQIQGTARSSAMPYIVNIQGKGRGQLMGGARLGAVKLATGGSSIVVQDAFKTDIQDFKGGIKFELGRKIHQMLPTGGPEGPG